MARILRVLLLAVCCLALADATAQKIDQSLKRRFHPPQPKRLRAREQQQPHRPGRRPPKPYVRPEPLDWGEVRPTVLAQRPTESAQRPAPASALRDPEPEPTRGTPRKTEREVTVAARPEAPPPPPQREPGYSLSRQDLEALFLSADDWLARATIKRARLPDGTPVGIYVNYEGDTPLARLGVQPGDILTHLNGHPLHTEDDYRWAGAELREASELEIEVDRGGAPVLLRFSVTP